ncbi:MAG TPA: hypothetical protein PKE29_14340 [Phycisphaerales bacterium]|nr:hypothetical protein [Phycisphaerales bacterium]
MLLSPTIHSPIGIDAGSRRVNAVQLARAPRARAWRLHAGASIPRHNATQDLTPGEFLRILDALRRQGFEGDRAVAAVSPTRTFSGVLELPARAGALPLDAIARQELARTCKRDASAIECAWWELPPPAGGSGGGVGAQRTGQSALAIGCAHADAVALLDALEGPQGGSALRSRAALDVIALDTAPTALARACASLLAPPPGLTAMLSICHEASQILILRAGLVVYERTLPEAGLRLLLSGIANQLGTAAVADDDSTPGSDIAEHILTTLGVNPPPLDADVENGIASAAPDVCALAGAHADALASELTASMTYAVRRFDSGVATVLLAGSGAAIPGLARRIGERAGLPTVVARPADLFPLAPGLNPATLGPGLTLAAGLALHGSTRGTLAGDAA